MTELWSDVEMRREVSFRTLKLARIRKSRKENNYIQEAQSNFVYENLACLILFMNSILLFERSARMLIKFERFSFNSCFCCFLLPQYGVFLLKSSISRN